MYYKQSSQILLLILHERVLGRGLVITIDIGINIVGRMKRNALYLASYNSVTAFIITTYNTNNEVRYHF